MPLFTRMKLDSNIGGGIDGTGGGDIADIGLQARAAGAAGFSGVWSTEVSRDPFLPLMPASEQAPELDVGTAVAVAFARTPMTTAMSAHDLQSFSRGQFHLGLGSQVKAHVERRFAMPWSEPAARMQEYVAALHAIWASWRDGTRLDFRGDFYQHTLMTPMFAPPPHGHGDPPVLLAAVGPRMTDAATAVADGLILHGFTTPRHLREVLVPRVVRGLQRAGRERADFVLSYPGLVATGESDEGLALAVAAVRKQIAFYGATPAYRQVLDLHGWGDLHEELHRLSVRQDWDTMTTLVDDEVLASFAVVGSPERAGEEIARRFGDEIDRFTVFTPYLLTDQARSRVVTAAIAGLG
jgi:probable F420-dependent oxidoreductase